jgi:hypothetical protein
MNPIFAEDTLKGGIERSFFDLEEVARGLLDGLSERVAVERALLECMQDHHLERAGEEVTAVFTGDVRLCLDSLCLE